MNGLTEVLAALHFVPLVVSGWVLVASRRQADRVRRRCRDRLGPDAARSSSVGPDRRGGGRLTLPSRPLHLAVVGVTLAVVVDPVVAVVMTSAVVVVPWWRDRRRAAARQRALVDDLPDLVDVVTLAAHAGCSPRHALAMATSHHQGPAAAVMADALHRADAGVALADELAALAVAVPAVAPLADAVGAAERSGAPLADGLQRLAADARRDRRRRREEAARRLPVSLLLPLVCCTLPAFALLTVVPVLFSSVRALDG